MNLNRIDNIAEIIGGKKTSFKQVHSAFSKVKDDRCCHFESLLYSQRLVYRDSDGLPLRPSLHG